MIYPTGFEQFKLGLEEEDSTEKKLEHRVLNFNQSKGTEDKQPLPKLSERQRLGNLTPGVVSNHHFDTHPMILKSLWE